MDLVGTHRKTERALLEQHVNVMVAMGCSPRDARRMSRRLLEMAIAASREAGTYYLPPNFGDVILGDAGTEVGAVKDLARDIRSRLPSLEAEGVTREDVRWWWNMSDVERRMVLLQDDVSRMAVFRQAMEESQGAGDSQYAALRVRNVFPMYGDPSDTSHGTGEDRPLPVELKDRVNRYIEGRVASDPDTYKREMESASTFNALVRKAIREGRL